MEIFFIFLLLFGLPPGNAWGTIRDKIKIGKLINLLNSDR